MTMNILVFGAGVVGSQYAARLRQAGHMVTLLARAERAAQVREHGIVLEAVNTGRVETVFVTVKEKLEEDDDYDLVIVAVRANQIAAVLPMLAANHQTPNVLFIGNNPSGAEALVKALGRERVLLGFGAVGGQRKGYVVQYYARPGKTFGRTYLGELDGLVSPRLVQVAIALTEARLGPELVPNMDAWLKVHAAIISPLALAVYSAGGDNYRLARTRDGLLLAVRAVREGLGVLNALKITVVPAVYHLLEWLPEPLLLVLLRGLINTQAAEINIAGHANAARDEMKLVADEFYNLVRASGRLSTAISELRTWVDPAAPLLAEGSASLQVDMRSVWIASGLMLGLLTTGLLGGTRRRKK
jgi:2-dehydropantoate 2-reductase